MRRGGRIRAHKKYKNKYKSPKAVTTEGTINCYMEADACIESLLTNNRFRPILFAIVILIFSVNHYKIREAGKQSSWLVNKI